MRVAHTVVLGLMAILFLSPVSARGQASGMRSVEARIWLDRGVDPVLQQGDQARVYYRASEDAYMVLFHVSTDGVLRLLFPGGSDDPHRVRGGRDYRLLFPSADHWEIDEDPGVGYFFVLASTEPLDFDRLSRTEVAGGWDSSPEGNRIRQDPYVTVDQFRRALLEGREDAEYAIDFTAYHVGQPYSYPRFVCYQCHEPEAFEEWNPYRTACHEVRVVIYNDPYFYPATRYQGGRVLFSTPPRPGLPQFSFKARGIGETGAPLVQARVPGGTRIVGTMGTTAIGPGVPIAPTDTTGDDTGFPIPISGSLGGTLGLDRSQPGNPLAPRADPTRSQPVVVTPGAETPDGGRSRPVLRRRPSEP